MTEILLNDLTLEYEDSIRNSNHGINNDQNNQEIPSVIIESSTNGLTRKDSIVIPSISNSSLSSAIQIESNDNKNNNELLPVCTSNSLGDLSSTPLLLLDNPLSNRSVISTQNPIEDHVDHSNHSQQSFPSSSSVSSASTTPVSDPSTPITHELLKNESLHEIEPLVFSSSKKSPAPPPPPPSTLTSVSNTLVESLPPKTIISQSIDEEISLSTIATISPIYSTDQHQPRRILNRQNHQRHGSADVLYRQSDHHHLNNHEYMNRSSTTCSSFYPQENVLSNPLNYYDYDQSRTYIQQIEEELRQTKEELNATMKSIKTFWSPELKKERSLRKEESCRYQLLINEHQKRTKQDSHIQSLEQQLRQMRDELEKSRHLQRQDLITIPATSIIPDQQPSNELNINLQRQYQELKDKLEQRTNDLHVKDNECVTLKAKVDTYESKEKDLQHYISILKESILIKDQQVNMIQSEMADLRTRLKEKDSIIEKKNSKIQSTRVDRQQREFDLQEIKQQLDIRDRKINVLNRKIENLEEQLRDKSNQIALTRAKLTAVTNTAAAVNIQQQSTLTTNTLVSNLEATIAEKERFIEKLREQKHSLEIEHQEEIDQLQKVLHETRTKLEQKEKDYYEGQNQIIELREQLNNCKSVLQRRENQIQTLDQQINNLKKTKNDFNDRGQLENENRTLQDRLSCYELERIEMKREIEWMQQELEQQKLGSVPATSISPSSSMTTTTSTDLIDQEQHFQILLNKKQERIEELEQAVRESFQITSEREYAMNQQKRKMENLEKQIKTLQNEVEHLRTENNDQSQLLDHLKTELVERKRQYEQRLEEQIKQLDNAFIAQQEKLLGELSEKDSLIAELEMDRNSSGASNRATIIEKLNTEKQQLHNQLKELTEIRMKIIQDHLTAKQEYERREKSFPFTGLIDGDGLFC